MTDEGFRRRAPPPSRELLIELWRNPRARSRNRNFYRFRDDPTFYRAARHIRSLRALRADLMRFQHRAEIRVAPLEDAPGHYRITMVIPRLRLKRSVYVTELELELLGQEPALKELVAIPAVSPDKTT